MAAEREIFQLKEELRKTNIILRERNELLKELVELFRKESEKE